METPGVGPELGETMRYVPMQQHIKSGSRWAGVAEYLSYQISEVQFNAAQFKLPRICFRDKENIMHQRNQLVGADAHVAKKLALALVEHPDMLILHNRK